MKVVACVATLDLRRLEYPLILIHARVKIARNTPEH